MTSSTKPEVHNISQRRNAVIEDRATATGNMCKNLEKFGHVVFELCERTDKQTYSHNTLHPSWGEVIIARSRAQLSRWQRWYRALPVIGAEQWRLHSTRKVRLPISVP